MRKREALRQFRALNKDALRYIKELQKQHASDDEKTISIRNLINHIDKVCSFCEQNLSNPKYQDDEDGEMTFIESNCKMLKLIKDKLKEEYNV